MHPLELSSLRHVSPQDPRRCDECDDNIKMDFIEMFCQDVEWITVVSEQREMRSHGEAVHSWLLVCMECRTGL